MRESRFQNELIEELKRRFPGCLVLKNDTSYLQGVPDLLVLYRDRWAMLEVKASANAAEQPNQRWYVESLNEMSFAAFIYPENAEEILHAIDEAFRTRRSTRVPRS